MVHVTAVAGRALARKGRKAPTGVRGADADREGCDLVLLIVNSLFLPAVAGRAHARIGEEMAHVIAVAGRAFARQGRHGRKQPFDIMHKVIMWWDPPSLILGNPRSASKGARGGWGVFCRGKVRRGVL